MTTEARAGRKRGAGRAGKAAAAEAAPAKPLAAKAPAPKALTAKRGKLPPVHPHAAEAGTDRVGRPVGSPVDPLAVRRAPDGRILFGRTVTLEPIDAVRHGTALFEASHGGDDPDGAIWTYMGYGPWANLAAFLGWLRGLAPSTDPHFYAIVPRRTRQASGMASYMNIRPGAGVVEIGHIWLALSLQKTREASEAIFLLMRHAFEDLGCRRLEWKCDALNVASRAAARRYGFTFEGVFRKHMIVKGRNRDTAWFSITDEEWPVIRDGFGRWLAEENFDPSGRQERPLSAFISRK